MSADASSHGRPDEVRGFAFKMTVPGESWIRHSWCVAWQVCSDVPGKRRVLDNPHFAGSDSRALGSGSTATSRRERGGLMRSVDVRVN
jgi:hypothetical protein